MTHFEKNWVEIELGLLFETLTGSTPSKKASKNYGGEIPFIKPPDLENKTIDTAGDYLSEIGASKARMLPKDSVLVTCIGNLGRTGINKYPVAFNQQINAIKPRSGIESKFTNYQCQNPYFKKALENLSSATTVAIVNKGKFNTIPFKLAPLPEQRAIVSKIEQLFSELDNGIANLKAAKTKLETYRQGVLKKAFEGELTKEWRKNQNRNLNLAAEPIAEYDQVKQSQAKKNRSNGLPEGWEWARLAEICEKIQDGSHYSPKKKFKEFRKGLFPYVTSKNIRNNYMDLDSLEYVEKNFHDTIYPRCDAQFGDVLLTKDGVNTGNVTLNIFKEPISLLSSVCLIRPSEGLLNRSFLKYYIQSPSGFNEMTGQMTGTAIKRIILKRIKQTTLSLPTLMEQTQIVHEIESRLSVCDKLSESIDQSLEQATALRQSILKKAFAGELLSAKELEACKKEPDWEPAEKLVAWIKECNKN